MLDVIGDIQYVISAYEYYRTKDKSTVPERRISILRRTSLNLNDRREVIRSMFWLEQFPEISDLSVRDIRPHVQIVIRQALEMIFREIIGYVEIIDKSGKRDRKSTQAGYDFLQQRWKKQPSKPCVAKGVNWELIMPIPLKTIEMLNSWCNNFTHKPWIVRIHIQHYVYSQYERIVRVWSTNPKVYINGIDNMRADFETYLAEKNSSAVVNGLMVLLKVIKEFLL